MLRRDIEKLVRTLAKLKPDLKDLALTTNGLSSPEKAKLLRRGADRVTISLDQFGC